MVRFVRIANHDEHLRREHARSHGHLNRYHAANPHVLSNPETYRRAHDMMTEAQRDDLQRAGVYDPEGFRRLSGGRDPTAQEIQDHHLKARTHSPWAVRSADRLIDHVHSRLHE